MKKSKFEALVDPSIYDTAALRSMAEAIMFHLGGPEGAAKVLSGRHFMTLCVCASFIDSEGE